MDQILADKVALITGAGRGIGKALAVGFANLGAKIILTARTEEQLNETLAVIEGAGHEALVVLTDVAVYNQVKNVVDAGTERFGKIDILVNNAGYSRLKPIVKMRVEEFTNILNTNVLGVYNCTHAVVPGILEKEGGSIVNTGSIAIYVPMPRWSAYSMSKSALIGFTEALAEELKPKINVNTIMPSYVDTPLLHTGMSDENVAKLNPMQPEELVPYYAFFATPDGKRLTGINLNMETMLNVLKIASDMSAESQTLVQWDFLEPVVAEKFTPEQMRMLKKSKKLINFILKEKTTDAT